MVWLPIAKATSQRAVVWLPIAKAKNDAYFKFFPAFEQELLQVFSHSEQETQPDKPAGYVSVERFDILSNEGGP